MDELKRLINQLNKKQKTQVLEKILDMLRNEEVPE